MPPVRVKSQSTELGDKQRLEPEGENDSLELNFSFFRELMESNRPPPGIGATNRDWRNGVE